MNKKTKPLFSLICECCTARLTVRQTSAIGQKLACPKCGEMLLVKAPEGWTPPPEQAVNSSLNAGSFAESGFDDIDQILSSASAPPKTQRRPDQNKAKQKSKQETKQRTVQRPANLSPPENRLPPKSGTSQPARAPSGQPSPNPADDGPLLPNQQWTSADSQSRKKLVTTIAAIVGGLLLIGALVTGIVVNLGSSDDKPIATQTDDPNSNDPTNDPFTEKDPPATDETPTETATGGTNPTVDPANPETTDSTDSADTDIDPAIKDPGNPDQNNDMATNAESNDPPLVDLINQPPAATDDSTKKNVDDAALLLAPVKDRPRIDEGNGARDPILNAADMARPDDINDSLGGLSALLEQAGLSIMKIDDIAADLRDQEMVGLPKYFVAKPNPLEVDPADALASPCNGIRYSETPLITFLRDMQTLTGVPISIDSQSLATAKISADTPVNVSLKNVTFDAALDAAINPLGMSKELDPESGVLVISIPALKKMANRAVEIPEVKEPSEEKHQNFADSIKVLIDPESWTRGNEPGTISVAGARMNVKQSGIVLSQLDEFATKLKLAGKVANGADDPGIQQSLQPRYKFAQASLAAAPKLKPGISVPLEDLLSTIQRNTGVVILVDWQRVTPLGWNQNALVPGNIKETSVLAVVQEIAHSMEITSRVVDSKTIELTTFERVSDLAEIEVYPIGEITSGPLNVDQIFSLLESALGTELRTQPRMRIIHEGEFECIITYAPQSIQRQVDAILDRLKQVGK